MQCSDMLARGSRCLGVSKQTSLFVDRWVRNDPANQFEVAVADLTATGFYKVCMHTPDALPARREGVKKRLISLFLIGKPDQEGRPV